MEKLKMRVVEHTNKSEFEHILDQVIEDFQIKGFVVTINNPHLVTSGPSGQHNYVAVVEGRKEA